MKKINLNNSADLQKLQESLNVILESKIANAKREEIIENFNNLPLGALGDIFYSVTDKLFESVEGKKVIAKYIKVLKENRDLGSAFAIHHFTNAPEYVENVPLFISETIGISRDINKKRLNEGKSEVSKIVAEAVRAVGLTREEIEEAISRNQKVNEAIDYLVNNKKTTKNLYEYVQSIETITEHVSNSVPQEKPVNEGKSVKELSENLSRTITESSLEPWETETLWDIVSAKLSKCNRENIFETYKNKCLDTMNSILESQDNVAEKSRISSMKSQLEEKKYSENSFVEDVFNLSKLNHTLLN